MSEPNLFARAGTTVSHYRILEPIGGGGMGVVYKAQDLELNRLVALKFLSADVAWGSNESGAAARARFMQEARAASALDHPNIATIHAIDHTADGQLFIAMAYYEGETLRQKLARGPLPPAEAMAVFTQVAQGIAQAHAAGIVHRDIKPGNVMMTRDGAAKVIDFGLAKLGDVTRITDPGTTLGTIAYMAPEQVRGEEVDARADLWALGVVLFEMLTGQLPFRGSNAAALMHAILTDDPAPTIESRPEIAPALRRIVKRTLEKAPENRYASAAALLGELARFDREERPAVTATPTGPAVRLAGLAAVLLALAATAGGGWWWWQRTNERTWARAEAIPEIARLADADRYQEAYALATRVEPILPGALGNLWSRIAVEASVETVPPGADVFVKEYGDTTGPWRALGKSPLKGVRLARGLKRWKVEAGGHITLERAAVPGALRFPLLKQGGAPDGMVAVPGGPATAWIAGMDPIEGVPVENYLIDRYEVTNRQFKAFIDAGGYTRREFWKHPIVKDGRELSWEEGTKAFRDATGRPGPSTWELGTYPQGQEDHPASGVSWYEAAAYAEYAGKSLPTVYHWVRAASTRLPSYIVPLSNYSGKAAAVGAFQGMSEFGVHDMAGNAREWLWNASGSLRHILGGAWADPTYMFTFANARPPLDRSAGNGFRCAVYPGNRIPPTAGTAVELSHRDYSKERPASDDLWRAYLNQFSYDASPIEARRDSASDTADWRYEKVSFGAAYGRERVVAHVYLPKTGRPPYQTIVLYPGSSAIVATSSDNQYRFHANFLTKSGRAFVLPVYKGTYERNDGLTSTWPSLTHKHVEYLVRQVKDFKRTVDYLETRQEEFDLGRLAYYGVSWGGRMAAIIPAVDRRVKLNIVELGGLAAGRSLPEVDQINYISRVTVPVLMINGRFDAIEPVDSAQLPMFRMWGTPAEQKRHVIFETGHGPFPPNAYIKEVLDWLDHHFGPAV